MEEKAKRGVQAYLQLSHLHSKRTKDKALTKCPK